MRNHREFHFGLPRIERKKAIGLTSVAIITVLLALSSCVSPERIGARTVMMCDTTTKLLYEGARINENEGNYDAIMGSRKPIHITNPFLVKGSRGKMYLVGYQHGGGNGPILQNFVPLEKATLNPDCQQVSGTVGEYDPENGYQFVVTSGEKFFVGHVWVEK